MRKRLELLVLFVEIEGKKLSKLVARKWLLLESIAGSLVENGLPFNELLRGERVQSQF